MTEQERTRPWHLRIARIAAWALGLFLVLVVASAALIWFRKDQLLKEMVSRLNDKLRVPVKVEKIGLSIDQFPKVGVAFESVWIPDPLHPGDTLLFASEMSATSDFRNWLRGSYPINHLVLRSGFLSIYIPKAGPPNYDLLRPSDPGDSSVAIELKSVELRSFRVVYVDRKLDLEFRSKGLDFDAKGDFVPLDVDIESRWKSVFFRTADFEYAANQGAAEFYGNPQVAEGVFESPELKARYSFDFSKGQQWSAKGRIADPVTLGRQIGAKLPESIESISGGADFELESRKISGVESFSFKARSDAQKLSYRGLPPLELDYSVTGRLEKGSKVFDFDRLKLVGKGVNYQGVLSLSLGSKARANLKGSFELDLALAHRFGEFKEVKSVEGFARGTIAYSGPLGTDHRPDAWTGLVELESVGLANEVITIKNATGSVSIKEGQFELSNMLCKINGQEAFINGKLYGFFGGVEDRSANLSVRTAELRILNSPQASKENASGKGLPVAMPQFPIRLSLEVDRFYYGKLKLDQVRIDALAKPDQIEFYRLYAEGMNGGSIDGSALLQTSPSGFDWSCKGKGLGLDLSELFRQFDGFGQDQLSEKQLSGRADIDFETRFSIDRSFEVNLSSVVADAEIRFRNARLKDFAPLQALSLFAQKEALGDLSIEEYTAKLSIRDRLVALAPSAIATNAFVLELGGVHGFDQTIDYRAALKLEDLITKGKKQSGELDDYIQEVSSRPKPILRFRILGTVDRPVVSIDREASAEKLGSEWKNQFRPSKKDSVGTTKENPLEFEWEEGKNY